ncbi:MAG: hypothetical protein J6039_06435, partial [Alphaproteobacteria bacterium]|nr:hypothetical protein [Alphaproteobacteria bacterium]
TRQNNTDSTASCYCNISAELTKPDTEETGEDSGACSVEQTCSVACTSSDGALSQGCGCGGTQTRSGYKSGTQTQSGLKKRSKTHTRTVTCDSNGGGWQTGEWGAWSYGSYGSCVGSGSWSACADFGSCDWGGWGTCTKSNCGTGEVCQSGTCVNCSSVYPVSAGWYEGSNKPEDCALKIDGPVTCGGKSYTRYNAIPRMECSAEYEIYQREGYNSSTGNYYSYDYVHFGDRWDEATCSCIKDTCSDNSVCSDGTFCNDTDASGLAGHCDDMGTPVETDLSDKTFYSTNDDYPWYLCSYKNGAYTALGDDGLETCQIEDENGMTRYAAENWCEAKGYTLYANAYDILSMSMDDLYALVMKFGKDGEYSNNGKPFRNVSFWTASQKNGYYIEVYIYLDKSTEYFNYSYDDGRRGWHKAYSDGNWTRMGVQVQPGAQGWDPDPKPLCVAGSCTGCTSSQVCKNGTCVSCASAFLESEGWSASGSAPTAGCYTDTVIATQKCGGDTYKQYAHMDTTCTENNYGWSETDCECRNYGCPSEYHGYPFKQLTIYTREDQLAPYSEVWETMISPVYSRMNCVYDKCPLGYTMYKVDGSYICRDCSETLTPSDGWTPNSESPGDNYVLLKTNTCGNLPYYQYQDAGCAKGSVQCAAGQYCKTSTLTSITDNTETCHDRVGSCTATGTVRRVVMPGLGEVVYSYADNLNWYDAKAWCEGQGYSLYSLSERRGNKTMLGQGMMLTSGFSNVTYAWTADANCSSGKTFADNVRDEQLSNGHYAICKNGDIPLLSDFDVPVFGCRVKVTSTDSGGNTVETYTVGTCASGQYCAIHYYSGAGETDNYYGRRNGSCTSVGTVKTANISGLGTVIYGDSEAIGSWSSAKAWCEANGAVMLTKDQLSNYFSVIKTTFNTDIHQLWSSTPYGGTTDNTEKAYRINGNGSMSAQPRSEMSTYRPICIR